MSHQTSQSDDDRLGDLPLPIQSNALPLNSASTNAGPGPVTENYSRKPTFGPRRPSDAANAIARSAPHTRESSPAPYAANQFLPLSERRGNLSPRYPPDSNGVAGVRGRSRAGSVAANQREISRPPRSVPESVIQDGELKLMPYGHHRQTSIVNGTINGHSRNGSYSDGPLSPKIIAAAGQGLGLAPGAGAYTNGFDMMTAMTTPTTTARLEPDGMSGAPGGIVASKGAPAQFVGRNGPPQTEFNSLTMKRVDRHPSISGRSKPSRAHITHPSASRPLQQTEPKSTSDFALHVLFNSFQAAADAKVALCITNPLEPEPNIERICGAGSDPAFDQLVEALGLVAKERPKLLIDSLMLWRKKKSDAASAARHELSAYEAQLISKGPDERGLPRRNTEPVGVERVPDVQSAFSGANLHAMKIGVAQAERRSTVSIYILCRVLSEVIGQSSLARITVEMEEKLEGIIFSQLKIVDPDTLSASTLKLANWNLFSKLLGVMSNINFDGVAKRFLADLEKSQAEIDSRNPPSRDIEGRIELVLGGMKHLRMKTEPGEAWDRTCDFLLCLSRFFAKSHGRRTKYAYCQMLDTLLLPIASIATRELSNPKWAEFLSTTTQRLASMLTKPAHWPIAFPLQATLLCVSPAETFNAQWLQIVLPLGSKLKDRLTRASCLQVISRLLWTFLYRCNAEPPNATYRKLDQIVSLVLPPGKKTHTLDPSIVDPLIEIIRIIGFRHQDFCFKAIISPLINSDVFAPGKDVNSVRIEQLEPEKMVIGIRAFLAIMADLEQGEAGRPPFPQKYQSNLQTERLPSSPILSMPRSRIPLTKTASDRNSRAFVTAGLNEVTRDYYKRFCEILGKITIICDDAFGGQATLDEKFAPPPMPKTPLAESFSFRRDDLLSPTDQKHCYYELLHVAVQALPRCLSADIPLNSLINLLCTGTAHMQTRIAQSSKEAIRSIARQGHAQSVTIGFARFIFSFDGKYATMSDGGMLGPAHVENTLLLYTELLQIWIDEIKAKSKEAAALAEETGEQRSALDISGIWAHVEEVEAHGLFFLCSQSRRVRAFAITVLRLITEFDKALGQDNARLIQILEGDSLKVMSFNDENLSVAERSRLQRGMKNNNSQAALIELCSSDVSYDTTLWFKVFPNLMRISYDKCPVVVTLARELICDRILQMYKGVAALSETRSQHHYEVSGPRIGYKASTTPPEVMVEQWKLYLIVACTTLTDTGGQTAPATDMKEHLRKGSKATFIHAKINSARTLFKYILPLLSVGHPLVREAVVTALGSINVNIYKTLLDELQDAVTRCKDDARARMHQRSASTSRRNKKMDTLRTEVTQVYRLTTHFLREKAVYEDDWILNNLVSYSKDLKLFLMDGEIQMDWVFQKLRRHYCGLMEELFEGINRTDDPGRWMTFEMRKSSFALMEDWCGYSPNQAQIMQREEQMRMNMMDQQSLGERPTINASMEKEKNSLRTAALRAMATLCGGPISVTTEKGTNLQFDIRRMLVWIETIFNTESDRMHLIGRRALKNLVTHNKEYPYLLEHAIARCYITDQPKALQSYFEVTSEILLEHPDFLLPFWRILGLGLYTLGSDMSELRSKSAALLRTLEERQNRNSKIQDFDISISDKTKAVYKLAQFEMSRRLAKTHSDCAFLIFSEFTVYFKSLATMKQQNMVAAILPWMQTIELQLDPNGGPTPQSYVLLVNLFEITIKSSVSLHNEVQALWQALATEHGGNVKLVLDFIMNLCIDRREQNFVEYAKQIVVFLSATAAGQEVVAFFLQKITPKSMIPSERNPAPAPPDVSAMPYVAELSEALPVGTKQAAFSLGQLSMILLVDLMVSPDKLNAESVPLLLQVVTVLWDHYTPLVQDQAREMLIHLIHELVISRIEDGSETTPSKTEIEELIESIRRHDTDIIWSYEDSNSKGEEKDSKVPSAMEKLTTQVVDTFELTHPGIKEQWGKLSLLWATSCSVRHIACRSFQVFRCILTTLDHRMLADMLARLSNTIASEDPDVQTFSMEVLTTLKTLISKLDPKDLVTFPQLFWTACACLDTINEAEFLESIGMLDEFLAKLDLGEPMVVMLLYDGQPTKWEGEFEGLQRLVEKGLRSSACLPQTLDTINKLVQIPSGDLVGDDTRLLFATLANAPSFIHALDTAPAEDKTGGIAATLARIATKQGLDALASVLSNYFNSRFRTSSDFITELVDAISLTYLPALDFPIIKFLMGFLSNALPCFRNATMTILSSLIPHLNMRSPAIAAHGPDLISPLLRLLQGPECMRALAVLDTISSLTGGVSGDEVHLRMSMIGLKPSKGEKKERKEYERTESLFGIPEESGWSVPAPGVRAERARNNVQKAFHMCQTLDPAGPASAGGTDDDATPLAHANVGDVQFHVDDQDDLNYGAAQLTYPFPAFDSSMGMGMGLERADTMLSDDITLISPNLHYDSYHQQPHQQHQHIIGLDLVDKIDALDDFFEESLYDSSTASEGRSSRTVTELDGTHLRHASESDFEVEGTMFEELRGPGPGLNSNVSEGVNPHSSPYSAFNGFDTPTVQRERPPMNPAAFNFPANNGARQETLNGTGSAGAGGGGGHGHNLSINSSLAQSSAGVGVGGVQAIGLGVRPPMHSRSITSPSAPSGFSYSYNHNYSGNNSTYFDYGTSDEEYHSAAEAEAFSDGERDGEEGGMGFESDTATGSGFGREGMRVGFRRLTARSEMSGGGRSPGVPRVVGYFGGGGNGGGGREKSRSPVGAI